ncbi:MAG: peptide ABC transporter substrate-binding protein [Anaerolineae bacterium]
MKFRIFLGIVCLAFIATVLSYGASVFSPEVEPIALIEPTPELVAEISESISCEGEEVTFATGPLVVGIVGRPATLLPFNLASSSPRSQIETELSKLIFRGLVRYTSEGEPVPDLASWQVSEDGLSLTFAFDQGAVWHDGTPVTANDAAFTISTLASGNYAVPGNFPWESVTVQVLDSAMLQVSLPAPYSPFLEAATVGLLPAHLGLDGQNLQDSDFAAKPVGNGEFAVSNQWESDGLILLNPLKQSFLNQLELRFYPSLAAMTSDFAGEEVDLAVLPTYTPISALGRLSAEQVKLLSGPAEQATQLFFRMDAATELDETELPPPIADLAVRQALSIALDRRALIDAVADGQGITTSGLWPLHDRFDDQTQLSNDLADLSSAEALLDEAGWVVPDGGLTTIREKAGASLELEILTTNQGINLAIGSELARQWAELGVQASVKALPSSEYEAAIAGRQFDVIVQKTNLFNDPDLYDFWSQEAIVRGQNISRWNSRPASEALEAGRQVWEYELRKPYYNAFRTFFDKDLPATFLFQDIRSVAVNSRVRGQMLAYPGDLVEFMSHFPNWYILDENPETVCSETTS